MKHFIETCARWSVRWRWFVVIGMPLAIILLSGPAANIYFAHSSDMWFGKNDPVNQSYQELKDKFGDVQNLLVAVEANNDSNSVIDPKAMDVVARIHKFLEKYDSVVSVESLANYQYIKSADDVMSINNLFESPEQAKKILSDASERQRVVGILSNEKIILGDLITPDMRHTMILAKTQIEEGGRVDKQKKLILDLKDFLDAQHFELDGVKVHIFGRPFISYALSSGNERDQGIAYPLIIITSAILLGFIFRSFRAVLFPWLTIICSLLGVYAVQGALRLPTTVVNSSIPFLMITIMIGLSIHIMIDYFKELAKGVDSKTAAVESISGLAVVMFYTTFTTLIGFAGLAITNMPPLREYSFISAVGVCLCFLLSFTFFPALISFIRRAPKWAYATETDSLWLTAISRFASKHNKGILIFGGVSMLVFAGMTLTLSMDTNFVKMFKPDSDFRKEFKYFDEVFKGGQSIELIVDSGAEDGIYEPEFLNKVDSLQNYMGSIHGLGKSSSLLDFLKQLNKSLNNDKPDQWRIADSRELVAQDLFLYENSSPERALTEFYSPDRRYLKVTTRAANMSVLETRKIIDQLQDEINKNYADLHIKITGELPLFNALEVYIAKGTMSSFGFSLLCITLCFVVLFKNIPRSLLAMLPNIYPIFLAGAVMKVTGITPDINTLIIASIALGIAVDDTIHYKIRFENSIREGKSVDEALDDTFRSAGRGVILSTVTLVLGFGVFLFSSMQSSINFGIIAIVILLAALASDMLFLPAILKRWGLVGAKQATQVQQPAEAVHSLMPVKEI